MLMVHLYVAVVMSVMVAPGESMLRHVVAQGSPKWTEETVTKVLEKLERAGVRSVQDLKAQLMAPGPGPGAALNARLVQNGDSKFGRTTLMNFYKAIANLRQASSAPVQTVRRQVPVRPEGDMGDTPIEDSDEEEVESGAEDGDASSMDSSDEDSYATARGSGSEDDYSGPCDICVTFVKDDPTLVMPGSNSPPGEIGDGEVMCCLDYGQRYLHLNPKPGWDGKEKPDTLVVIKERGAGGDGEDLETKGTIDLIARGKLQAVQLSNGESFDLQYEQDMAMCRQDGLKTCKAAGYTIGVHASKRNLGVHEDRERRAQSQGGGDGSCRCHWNSQDAVCDNYTGASKTCEKWCNHVNRRCKLENREDLCNQVNQKVEKQEICALQHSAATLLKDTPR